MFRVSRKQVIWVCANLGTMLDAGLPVTRALAVLFRRAGRGRLHRALRNTHADIERGQTLAEGFAAQGCFPGLMLQLVAVGEDSGTLDRTLAELTRFYEFQRRLWRKFTARLILPALQYVAAVAIVAIVSHVLSILLDTDSHARLVLLCGYGAPVAALALYRLVVRPLGGTPICHEIILGVPILGKAMRDLALARFSLVMHLMSEAGVPVKEALRRSLEATGNGAFSARSRKAAGIIEQGATVREALESTRLFPRQYLEIVEIAEESGSLSERLNWLAEHHADRAEFSLGALVTALGWFIYAAVAAMIIFFIFRIALGYIQTLESFGL